MILTSEFSNTLSLKSGYSIFLLPMVCISKLKYANFISYYLNISFLFWQIITHIDYEQENKDSSRNN